MPRQSTVSLQPLGLRLQTQGPQTAAELASAFSVDRSHISRLIAQAGRNIVPIGSARRTRYALRRPVRGIGDSWPVYRIDRDGRAHEFAHLEAFYTGWRIHWSDPAPAWIRIVTDPDGWSEGFPFFLSDLRPQGFMGRSIARRVATTLSLPNNPTTWSDDDILSYFQSEGEDLPGDFVVGDRPLRQALAKQDVITASRDGYPALATAAVEGGVPGSSAGGEQPKFLTRIAGEEGGRSVLVKFSAPMDTPIGRRWADLLLAEAIASEILAEQGEGIANVHAVDVGGRRFLEVPRFDRVGMRGRRGVVSLAGLQGTEGAIETTDWVVATEHFAAEGVVSSAAVASVRRRRAFGELIGNSDMHPGNLAFFLSDSVPLELTPCYDMLPMLWAPVASGELVPRTLSPLPPVPRQLPDWRIAAEWAQSFWQRLANDRRVSAEFADVARSAAETVDQLRRTI